MNQEIALMYLAEQTSPEDYELKNLDVVNNLGIFFVEFDAVLHSFDVMNRNKRMYDGNNVMQVINTTERIQDYLNKNGWFGEMDHPCQDHENLQLTSERIQRIEMSRRSHIIGRPIHKNGLLYAHIKTAGTDCGIGMARDVVAGLIPGFSCRSIATMKMVGGKPYVFIKKLVTYDWVLYNSHREAIKVGKASLVTGTQKVVLESTNHFGYKTFDRVSKDVCVNMNEFTDFKEALANADGNIDVVLESTNSSYHDIVGFDAGNNIILESVGNKIYINTNLKTKKKVEDFLSSF